MPACGSESKKTNEPKKSQLPKEGYQLSFFQMDDPVLSQVRDEIVNLDVNNLTPIEALNKLNEIKKIADEGLRFILCSCMLGFGGICVCMQTFSVTAGLNCNNYIIGKAFQTLVSCILSSATAVLLFNSRCSTILPILLFSLITISLFVLIKTKKVVAIRGKMLYNTKKRRGLLCGIN